MEATQNLRANLAMAAIVETGICENEAYGAARAWALLEHRGVPLTVIKRVLARPALRRHADPSQ